MEEEGSSRLSLLDASSKGISYLVFMADKREVLYYAVSGYLTERLCGLLQQWERVT